MNIQEEAWGILREAGHEYLSRLINIHRGAANCGRRPGGRVGLMNTHERSFTYQAAEKPQRGVRGPR